MIVSVEDEIDPSKEILKYESVSVARDRFHKNLTEMELCLHVCLAQ